MVYSFLPLLSDSLLSQCFRRPCCFCPLTLYNITPVLVIKYINQRCQILIKKLFLLSHKQHFLSGGEESVMRRVPPNNLPSQSVCLCLCIPPFKTRVTICPAVLFMSLTSLAPASTAIYLIIVTFYPLNIIRLIELYTVQGVAKYVSENIE